MWLMIEEMCFGFFGRGERLSLRSISQLVLSDGIPIEAYEMKLTLDDFGQPNKYCSN